MAEPQAVFNRESVGHPTGEHVGTPFPIQRRPPSQAGRRSGPQQNGQVVRHPRQGALPLPTNPLPQGQDSYHPAGSIGYQQQQQQAPTITALSQTQPVQYNSIAEAIAARDWGTAARLEILEKDASLREKDALLLEKEKLWGGRYRVLHHEKQQIEEQHALGIQALESQHTVDLTHLRLVHAEDLKLETKANSTLQLTNQALQAALHQEQSANRAVQTRLDGASLLSNGFRMEVTRLEGELNVAHTEVNAFEQKYQGARATALDLHTKLRVAHALSNSLRMEVTRLERSLDIAQDALDNLEQKHQIAEVKVEELERLVSTQQVKNENLQAALRLKEKGRLVVVRQLDNAITDRKAETNASARCETDRQTEVDENLDLAKKYAEAKQWKLELESMVHSHNHTLRKRDIALAEKDTALENLRKACDILQEQLKWAEGRNIDLSKEKVTAVKEAKKKVEDKCKQTETTLEQEKADLKAQVEQLQQDLQVAREALEEAQDGHAAAQQKLEECRELRLAEDAIRTQRKRLLDGDSIGAPAPKKPRVSTEMTPPKTPTPKTGQEAVFPTPAPAVMTPHIEISLKNAKSLLPPPPPGPLNQASRPATPQSPKSPTEFVEPLTPIASRTAPLPQPPMRNKKSSLPALPLNSSGKHRPPEDPRY